jgi:hypothetical protein
MHDAQAAWFEYTMRFSQSAQLIGKILETKH